ncbi:hypothetical protein M9H77_30850 [Catharanthus roseus]|uniref:Uncharacterized protein n=1 Tax=Catharanthus roseus TaxID=4058 RepID=A0ACC0A2Q1_CATRO|nr:hypothetical protein M9H77_30850 [Catharanthus roseus]
MKKLKFHDTNIDNGMVAYMEDTLKNKLEGFEDQGKASKWLSIYTIYKHHSREQIRGLIMSTDGYLPTQSHQEGLARQFQVVARDVEELKRSKCSATMEQRDRDNLGGFNSPHYQRPFDNVSIYGYHDMPVQNSYPFHDVEYQGRPQIRGGKRGEYYRHKQRFQDMKHGMNIICMTITEKILILAKHTMVATIVINNGIKL